MAETPGTDTIVPLATVPERIEVPRSIIRRGQELVSKWAIHHLAFIPYCVQCKAVLNWVKDEGDVIFRCPICNREWVKDNDWLLSETLRIVEDEEEQDA